MATSLGTNVVIVTRVHCVYLRNAGWKVKTRSVAYDLGVRYLLRPVCPNTWVKYGTSFHSYLEHRLLTRSSYQQLLFRNWLRSKGAVGTYDQWKPIVYPWSLSALFIFSISRLCNVCTENGEDLEQQTRTSWLPVFAVRMYGRDLLLGLTS